MIKVEPSLYGLLWKVTGLRAGTGSWAGCDYKYTLSRHFTYKGAMKAAERYRGQL